MNRHSTSSAISLQGNYKNLSEVQATLAQAPAHEADGWSVYWDSYTGLVVQLRDTEVRTNE